MKKRTLKKIIFALFILLFLLILSLVLFYETNLFDKKVYSVVSGFINDTNTTIFKAITFLGSTFAISVLCIISILFLKKWRAYICLNTIFAVLESQALKFIIRRSRPIDINIIEESGFSFPSGHSMVSAVFYGLIIYLIYKSSMKNSTKIVSICALASIILMIGLSRIYLGVHYATDVLGGFSLAIVHLILFIEIIYKNKFKFKVLNKLK